MVTMMEAEDIPFPTVLTVQEAEGRVQVGLAEGLKEILEATELAQVMLPQI